MKHTKNILKSLLITVMALSLLAVSCSKDEGGNKPTAPTSITINAKMLDEAIKLAAEQLATDTALSSKVTFNFDTFTSADGKGNASAKVTAVVTGANLKEALESAFTISDNDFSSTAVAGTIEDDAQKADLTITITLKGNNTFASDISPAYTKEGEKAVKTVITITADKKWNNKAAG